MTWCDPPSWATCRLFCSSAWRNRGEGFAVKDANWTVGNIYISPWRLGTFYMLCHIKHWLTGVFVPGVYIEVTLLHLCTFFQRKLICIIAFLYMAFSNCHSFSDHGHSPWYDETSGCCKSIIIFLCSKPFDTEAKLFRPGWCGCIFMLLWHIIF